MNSAIRVLSFPARHPYMSKFNDGENIIFVNPDTDLFNQHLYNPKRLDEKYPPLNYDVVHIHFSFDKVPLAEFKIFLEYFRSINKPIVWTVHSLESLRIKDYGNGEYQKLLFDYSDKLISPTEGCKKYLLEKYGQHKKEIDVIPLGYMANPNDIEALKGGNKKDRNLFTILIGDFRENKEIIQSVVNFLQCSKLENCKLQLIYKPINPYRDEFNNLNEVMINFFKLTQHPRVTNLSLPNFSNQLLAEAFLKSHAVILPYKWGTHSGQIELARDCGCHVVVTDVGYYREQWDQISVWNISDNKYLEFPNRYTNCLIDVYEKDSLSPVGSSRLNELQMMIIQHVDIYNTLINKNEQK